MADQPLCFASRRWTYSKIESADTVDFEHTRLAVAVVIAALFVKLWRAFTPFSFPSPAGEGVKRNAFDGWGM